MDSELSRTAQSRPRGLYWTEEELPEGGFRFHHVANMREGVMKIVLGVGAGIGSIALFAVLLIAPIVAVMSVSGFGFGAINLRRGIREVLRKTRITIDDDRFRLANERLPGRDVVELTANITSFTSSQQTLVYESSGTDTSPFQVFAHMGDGRMLILPLDLADAEHAEWVAARLNERLAQLRRPIGYRG